MTLQSKDKETDFLGRWSLGLVCNKCSVDLIIVVNNGFLASQHCLVDYLIDDKG